MTQSSKSAVAAGKTSNFDLILDDLYAGIVDPNALETALRTAKNHIGATGVNLHAVSKSTLETLFFVGFGESFTEENISAYLDHWQYVNAHRDAMRRTYHPERCPVFLCHEHISEDDWARGGYFQDFFSKVGQRWLAGGIVWNSSHIEISIAFSRPATSEPFGEEARAFLTEFIPHVRRAARVALKLDAPKLAGAIGVNNALETARTPSYLVDSRGFISWKNEAAQKILKEDGLLTERDGRLVLQNNELNSTLRRLIAGVIEKPLAETPPGIMKAQDGVVTLDIEVLPATVPRGALIEATALALVMVRPIQLSADVIDSLKSNYGLTDAECRLALSVANGGSVEDTALAAGVSQHTVRTQLRSIYSKTGVRRQAALAALIWKSV